jgi:UDP-2,3-diacylglucosamine pyrophosphatase LpxH
VRFARDRIDAPVELGFREVERRPLLVLSDLHLGPAAPPGTDEALDSILSLHPRHELVCLGDLFDLSTETNPEPTGAGVAQQIMGCSALRRAFRAHLERGSRITLVAGNHDAELTLPDVRFHLLRALDLPDSAALKIEPWWVRRASVHFEHGHVWDPDNAPVHPLAPTERNYEPLGVALTRRVLAPTGAFQFAHAHQTTPLKGLLWAVQELGVRAPEVIFRYFATGTRIFVAATTDGPARLRNLGVEAADEFARTHQLSPELISTLDSLRPLPRQVEAKAVFARLYFDRALATVVAASSLTLGLVATQTTLLLLAAAGMLYLAGSKGDRAHRYSASLLERVRRAALDIQPLVRADLVVFGHTHVAEAVPGYVNTGTFGFPGSNGRPFLVWDDTGALQRGYLDRGHEARFEPLPFVIP